MIYKNILCKKIMKSFSSEIKKELSELSNLSNKELVKAELEGYLSTTSSEEFITENEYNINRFGKLLSNIGENDYIIRMQGKNFCIKTKRKIKINEEIVSEEQIKAFIRGCFMGSGSITNPKNVYHLELVFDEKEKAKNVKDFLDKYEIYSKIIKRENKYILYMKEGNSISNFLAFIGANKSVLNFEDTRVIKDVRNKVNRIVNCETANLNKIISTAVRQSEDIKLIKKKNKFNKLTEKEKELANLRLENPNATLAQLGKMAKPEISKSGVNHRFENIAKCAQEIKDEEKKVKL